MTIMQDPKMGLYHGDSSLYSGRRGLYAGPKRHGGGFSPAQLPGLLAWYDPSLGEGVGYTLANGDVDQLIDQSGNGADSDQPTSIHRPNIASVNGLDATNHVNTDEHLENLTISVPSTGAIFGVFQRTSVLTERRFAFGCGGSGGIPGFRLFFEANGSIGWQVGDANGSVLVHSAPATYAQNDVVLIVGIWDGTEVKLRANGLEVSAPSTRNPAKTGDLAIGADIAVASPQFEWRGNIGELAMFGVPSAIDLVNLESYLSMKWGS